MSDLGAGGLLGCVLTFVALFVLAALAGRPQCSQCDDLFADYKELDDEYRDTVEFLGLLSEDVARLLDTPDDKMREGVEQIADAIDDWRYGD